MRRLLLLALLCLPATARADNPPGGILYGCQSSYCSEVSFQPGVGRGASWAP